MNASEVSRSYKKDGYVLLKNVFNPSEVADFKNRIALLADASKVDGSGMAGDALSALPLRSIMLDDRILDALRVLLGPKIVYFGDSTVRYEAAEGSRGFHKDSLGDFEDPSSTEHPVLRIGLYMQDHVRHSGGLKVRRGSHKHAFLGRSSLKRLFSSASPHGPLKLASFRLGRAINLDIEPGDLVIWNHRIFHSGYAVRLKMLPGLCINPRFEKYIPKTWTRPYEGPRAVLFASFGAPSVSLDRFIKDRVEHSSNIGHWSACHFDDPEIVQMCAQKGVDLRFDGLAQSRGHHGA
jgi:Phytanoyl-CoA dioxygenase (PhyH)